jgi:hypothetical protein
MKNFSDLLAQAEAYERELPPPTAAVTPHGAEIAAWIDHT